MTFYFDIDGVLADFKKNYLQLANKHSVLSYSFIRGIHPIGENIKVVEYLARQGHKIYVMATCSSDMWMKARRDWLEAHMPFIRDEDIIYLKSKDKKIKYVREPGILVDDDEKQCLDWSAAGLQSIHMPANKNLYKAMTEQKQ